MSESDLVERAQAAVGSADTIVAAAWFQPRGTSGGIMAGAEAGDVANDLAGGGIAGAAFSLAGTAIGYERGRKSGGFGTDRTDGMVVRRVPTQAMVAVSATRIYGWQITMSGGHRVPAEQLFDYARSDVTINVMSRVGVRVFEVEHPATSEKWEFESPRLTGHLKFVLDALHPDEPAS